MSCVQLQRHIIHIALAAILSTAANGEAATVEHSGLLRSEAKLQKAGALIEDPEKETAWPHGAASGKAAIVEHSGFARSEAKLQKASAMIEDPEKEMAWLHRSIGAPDAAENPMHTAVIGRPVAFAETKEHVKLDTKVSIASRPFEVDNIKHSTGWTHWCKKFKVDKSFAPFADKAGVKDYVRAQNLDIGITETFFIVEKSSEITLDMLSKLPSRFVMKGTHGSAMTLIADGEDWTCPAMLCDSRSPKDNSMATRLKFLQDTCQLWLGIDYRTHGNELFYSEIKPRCIAEEFLPQNDDFKVHMFGGVPMVVQFDTGRFSTHRQAYYTPSWNKLAITNFKEWLPTLDLEKPAQLSTLLKAAEVLSAKLDFVRADFYINDNKVYFGELTHSPQACAPGWTPGIAEQYFGYIFDNPGAPKNPEDLLSLLNSTRKQSLIEQPEQPVLTPGAVFVDD